MYKTILLIGLGLLSGCSFWDQQKSPYVIQMESFSSDAPSALTMDASKRAVLMKVRNTDGKKQHVSCSEPSPDVMGMLTLDVVKKLQLDLSAEGKSDISTSSEGDDTNSDNNQSNQSASAKGKIDSNTTDKSRIDISKLFERSQGIQALRDGLYRACEAHANGALTEDEYKTISLYYITTLNNVVPMEICANMFRDTMKNPELAKIKEFTKGDNGFGDDQEQELSAGVSAYQTCLQVSLQFSSDTVQMMFEKLQKNERELLMDKLIKQQLLKDKKSS
ncbi:MAG: hypothetical protein MI976_11250 [Pseudomonadales bacterium]|nr:hypothetical protein [Pseudomonadales bacterium]